MLLDQVKNLSINSHKRVKVKCDLNISEKCKNEYTLEYRNYCKFKNAKDELKCIFCSNKLNSGRNNPNTKYFNIDDKMFNFIDSKEKAYLLGWIASDGSIRKSGFAIQIRDYDIDVLEKINSYFFNNELPLSKQDNRVTLRISSQEIANDLIRIFKIQNEIIQNNSYKKSYIINFPDLNNEYIPYFIRGVFEGDGHYRYTKKTPACGIASSSHSFLKSIIDKANLITNINNGVFEIYGNNALDFLYFIYKNICEDNETLFMNRKYNFYKKIYGWIPRASKKCLYFKYKKIHKDASPPQKQRGSDRGYDLTLIEKIKTDGNVEFFSTGIIIEPTLGYYFDLVCRNSINKFGYMLANNTCTIDRTYKGPIIVSLIKFNLNKPDLELPCRLVQIIPRQIQHLEPIEITEEELLSSERKSGSFGSTGK